ncbi:hypothetical protein BaRGS_00009022 [Batillaria attramentaria]|uniref:G-protein coupled receptors family 1 profile domain-containing protein n=1 Tax=Batillaria attramentaria TaxID=370345 RepID=A0ABD0LKE1_9CAEN
MQRAKSRETEIKEAGAWLTSAYGQDESTRLYTFQQLSVAPASQSIAHYKRTNVLPVCPQTMNVTYSNTTDQVPTGNSVRDIMVVIEVYAPFAMAINKYVTPVWYVFGLIGNVISALFWSSQRLRTCNTAAVYLTFLAVADFSYLALHIFYELENPWLVHTLNVPLWCQLWNTLYMASQYFCVFLVCAFTVERFLSICHPFRSERFGRTRSPRIITVLLMTSLALSCPQAYFWHLGGGECRVRVVELAKASFYSVWNWCTDMLIFGALPVLVLVLNICVLRKIRHAGTLRLADSTTHTVSGAHYTRVGAPTKHTSRTSSTYGSGHNALISGTGNGSASAVNLFAIQTAIPLGDGGIPLEQMGSDPTWRRYIAYFAARVIIREIGMSHHVSNVFIYLATSRRFRRQVRKRMVSGAAVPCSSPSHTESTTINTMPLHHLKTDGK